MILQATPFIMMNGNAEEVIQFYQRSLNASLLFKQTFGEAPEDPNLPIPADAKGRVAHSVLKVGEAEMYVADIFPGESHRAGNQVNVCITTNDVEQSRQIYESLSQDGQVNLPMDATYFSPAYGVVTDKFGVTFQIFTKKPVS